MSTIDLVILGLLKDKNMSAYEIAQLLDAQILGRLVKASAPAAYKNIKKMHKLGYLNVKSAKEGEMPEKKIYSLTEKGDVYFGELMVRYSHYFNDFYLDFNAFLLNLNKVDRQTGLKMLTAVKSQIEKNKEWIIEHEKQTGKVFFAGRAIIKQVRMIMITLAKWIDEVIDEYKKEKDLGRNPFV